MNDLDQIELRKDIESLYRKALHVHADYCSPRGDQRRDNCNCGAESKNLSVDEALRRIFDRLGFAA